VIFLDPRISFSTENRRPEKPLDEDEQEKEKKIKNPIVSR
jgi:hypothetical protein